MIRSKTVTTTVDFNEQDALAFIEQADVVQKLFLIKRAVEALTMEELDRLEEYLTTGIGAQKPDGKTMKLFQLLMQLKIGLDTV